MTANPLPATITALTHDGRGIAHIDNKVTFIDGALLGETVEFQYTKKRRNFDEGKVDRIVRASPARVTPLCKHFEICGGCSLQHMNITSQIQYKEKNLIDQLHHAKITGFAVLPPLSAEPFGYRHKARIGVKYLHKKEKVLVGFREKNSGFLADLQRCETLHPKIGNLLDAFSQLINTLEIKNKIPQLEIAVDDHTAAVIVRHLAPMPASDQMRWIDFAKQHALQLYFQAAGPESIQLIWPENADVLLHYTLPEEQLKLAFHPLQFTQVNPAMNRLMIAQALQLLELKNSDTVLDLFCGIGNFTLPIAKRALSVVGVEGEVGAVLQARKNAEENNVKNAEFFVTNLFEPIKDFHWAKKKYTKILLDPPRAGAEELMHELKRWQPERVVYISCNPATFVRDAALLCTQGFHLKAVGVMDMFPQTEHVEVMGVFS